jgi:hypothetical protein
MSRDEEIKNVFSKLDQASTMRLLQTMTQFHVQQYREMCPIPYKQDANIPRQKDPPTKLFFMAALRDMMPGVEPYETK